MIGNGVSASLLGKPDVGLVDLTLFAQHEHRAAACWNVPLVCDSDIGYGNAVNVRHTVEVFEAAGVAAIHIEGQVAPKRCGQLPGSRPVIDLAEAVRKIETAVAARRDPDFVIIARTDAASDPGLDEAIRRLQALRQPGADVLFAALKNSPTIVDDMKGVTSRVDVPCLVNLNGGSRLGEMSAAKIGTLVFPIAIFPGLARNYDEITGRLGETWEVALNTYKPFACGIVIHPITDGCIQLRDKVTAAVDKSVHEDTTHITLKLNDGRTPEKQVEPAIGSLARAISDTDLEAKFRHFANAILAPDETDALVKWCRSLESLQDAGELARAAVPATARKLACARG